jgi:hypothetical protein
MKNYILTIGNEPMSVITTSDNQLNDFRTLVPLAVKENLSLDNLPELKAVVSHKDINFDLFLLGEDGEEIEAYLIQTEIYGNAKSEGTNSMLLEAYKTLFAAVENGTLEDNFFAIREQFKTVITKAKGE